MPDAPRNGGIYLIQNKVTGKQLGLPRQLGGRSFQTAPHHSGDQGAVWELEVVSGPGSTHCYRFKTTGPFAGLITKTRTLISGGSKATANARSLLISQTMANSRYGSQN
jgi:hypothetical protein